MGHADHRLQAAFKDIAGVDTAMSLYDFLTRPVLFDPATRRFVTDLNHLHTSWSPTPNWPHASVVHDAHRLIQEDCKDQIDKSGVPLFFHSLNVADDAFRLAKLRGFDNHEATTVWIAALCHDYLENAKDEVDLAYRTQTMWSTFQHHDPDIVNLVIMLTRTQKDMPYLIYSGQIGRTQDFTENSTDKAPFAAWLIKFCDSTNNRRSDRNRYLDDMRENAEVLRTEGKILDAMDVEEQLERKFQKLRMYDINIAMMAAKMGHAIDGQSTTLDFLLSPLGKKFRRPDYEATLKRGLGEGEYARYHTRLQTSLAANENGNPNDTGVHHPYIQRPTADRSPTPPEAA